MKILHYCHHQTIFAKFDLRIFYSTPIERNVWHYKQGNTGLIIRTVDNYDWNRELGNASLIRQVSEFNYIILYIISNFILNKTIVCEDRDPPWTNSKIKKVLREVKNINTLIINRTFYFYKASIICRHK